MVFPRLKSNHRKVIGLLDTLWRVEDCPESPSVVKVKSERKPAELAWLTPLRSRLSAE